MPLSAIAARRTSRLQQQTTNATLTNDTAPIGNVQRIEKRKRHDSRKRRAPLNEPERAPPSTETNSKTPLASGEPLPHAIHRYQGLNVRFDELIPHETIGIKPTKRSPPQGRQTTTRISIEDSQTLIIEGICELEIIQGPLLVTGAILRSSKQRHKIIALPPHPAIEIRSLQGSPDEQHPQPLVVLFHDPSHKKRKGRGYTYRHIRHVDIGNREGTDHEPLFRTVTNLCTKNKSVQVALAGPNSPEKTRLIQKLVNALLTRTSRHVLLLELDPGNPEFGPAGELSLYRITSPLLAPVSDTCTSKLWSVLYGEKSPSDSPTRYAQCAQRVIDIYKSHSRRTENCILIANIGAIMHGSATHTISQAMTNLETDLLMTLIGQDAIEYMHGPLDQLPAMTQYAYPVTLGTSSVIQDAHQRAPRHLQTIAPLDYFRGPNTDRHPLFLQLRDCHIVDVCGRVFDDHDSCLEVIFNGSILTIIDLSKTTSFDSDYGTANPTNRLADASIPSAHASGKGKTDLDQEGKVLAKDHPGSKPHWWTGFCVGHVVVNALDVKSSRILFFTDIDTSVFGPDNIRNLVFVRGRREVVNLSSQLQYEPWLPRSHRTQELGQPGAYDVSETETALLTSRPWRVRRNLK